MNHNTENQNTQKILITGGVGYIGSTISSVLSDFGYTPIILDSTKTNLKDFQNKHILFQGDFSDEDTLKTIFEIHPEISLVIHCAGLTSVPESMKHPISYYIENTTKSMNLFRFLSKTGCKKIIYSSSGSIYKSETNRPVKENDAIDVKSPYATSKFLTETLLNDFCSSEKMKAIIFRYFNPIGTDPNSRSGPKLNQQNSILGKLIEISSQKKPVFEIMGDSWETSDGTAIRDYIHVWDLALAHLKAIEKFDTILGDVNINNPPNSITLNLGSGIGTTVGEFFNTFKKVSGSTMSHKIREPRPGDVAGAYANIENAKTILSWHPTLSIDRGIKDALKWAKKIQTPN